MTVGDLGAVVAPPYDVLGPARPGSARWRATRERRPARRPGRRARGRPRTTATGARRGPSPRGAPTGRCTRTPGRRSTSTEQVYRVPGTDVERTQRGFFARLRLEALEPGSGVLPHERTLAAPREDRYRLLRATGVNTSPVVGLYGDPSGRAAAILATLASGPAAIDVGDDDGVRHRLWVVAADGPAASSVAELIAIASAEPVTIADGHHRYETALRYRDERRMSRSCEEDPAFDYLLMLFLETTAEPLTVLPTHRLVAGLGEDGVARLRAGLGDLFEVDADRPRRAPGGVRRRGGRRRRRGSVRALDPGRRVRPDGSPGRVRAVPAGGWSGTSAALDVVLLGVALERLAGIDPAAVAAGGRVTFTKSAAEAIDGGRRRPRRRSMPRSSSSRRPSPRSPPSRAEGDVMPQKSTYFYPKALTGLVINPLEW